ncbi:MAG: ThiF family adenylyltransferase [Candidatus Izemoplasmatales bacterium]
MDLSRLELITPHLDEIRNHTILIFGLGGVGSFAAEAIARCGFHHLILVDKDTVDPSNLNRQIVGLTSTIGKAKTNVMEERIKDINPDVIVDAFYQEVSLDTIDSFFLSKVDFIVEAIDDLDAKIIIAKMAQEKNIPLVASMGFANKFDPTKIKIARANQTHTDPLAKKYRYELKQQGVDLSPLVVFSEENPTKPIGNHAKLGSTSFVPSSAGLLIASIVFNYYRKEYLDE